MAGLPSVTELFNRTRLTVKVETSYTDGTSCKTALPDSVRWKKYSITYSLQHAQISLLAYTKCPIAIITGWLINKINANSWRSSNYQHVRVNTRAILFPFIKQIR